MEINNRPFPPLTSGGTLPGINLPPADKSPPPLTAEQKEALEKLRDAFKNQTPAPTGVKPTSTSLIDEVV
ncbi:hypothetical protein [Pseudomonas sessilinigenes]|uniref:Type III secretion effector protein n=1 Tax=Pseudomonas sessilinigenes TaxID=658629 RepID=A0ABX8MJZ9_9PSED|nr:hypothetical protein [Pseudomonas sessilinigenes]AZC27356.1 hypothetical protein C4K39_5716 [Pseudomonas sessilinigenes]QXH38730.1 hypothetical protein KSS89_21000 [Pseudomonas sessilinigenes]